jgi:hypothetical protein
MLQLLRLPALPAHQHGAAPHVEQPSEHHARPAHGAPAKAAFQVAPAVLTDECGHKVIE